MEQYNEYSTHTYDFKRRSEMEQRLIHWCRTHLQGRKAFRIHEARARVLAVRDQLVKEGVRGSVNITEPKVDGTWMGGSTANMSFAVIAKGRRIPSVTVNESYPYEKSDVPEWTGMDPKTDVQMKKWYYIVYWERHGNAFSHDLRMEPVAFVSDLHPVEWLRSWRKLGPRGAGERVIGHWQEISEAEAVEFSKVFNGQL